MIKVASALDLEALDILLTVDDPTADLEVWRTNALATPVLEGLGIQAPPLCKLKRGDVTDIHLVLLDALCMGRILRVGKVGQR